MRPLTQFERLGAALSDDELSSIIFILVVAGTGPPST
jgi:hypothetical protein